MFDGPVDANTALHLVNEAPVKFSWKTFHGRNYHLEHAFTRKKGWVHLDGEFWCMVAVVHFVSGPPNAKTAVCCRPPRRRRRQIALHGGLRVPAPPDPQDSLLHLRSGSCTGGVQDSNRQCLRGSRERPANAIARPAPRPWRPYTSAKVSAEFQASSVSEVALRCDGRHRAIVRPPCPHERKSERGGRGVWPWSRGSKPLTFCCLDMLFCVAAVALLFLPTRPFEKRRGGHDKQHDARNETQASSPLPPTLRLTSGALENRTSQRGRFGWGCLLPPPVLHFVSPLGSCFFSFSCHFFQTSLRCCPGNVASPAAITPTARTRERNCRSPPAARCLPRADAGVRTSVRSGALLMPPPPVPPSPAL